MRVPLRASPLCPSEAESSAKALESLARSICEWATKALLPPSARSGARSLETNPTAQTQKPGREAAPPEKSATPAPFPGPDRAAYATSGESECRAETDAVWERIAAPCAQDARKRPPTPAPQCDALQLTQLRSNRAPQTY